VTRTNHHQERLVLASGSLRRAEILSAVGWPFETVLAGIDESRAADEEAISYVQRLALAKAEAVAAKLDKGLVLGADTIVVVDGTILGKPEDAEDATRMLRMLSGKWHEVLTGVALVRADKKECAAVDHEITRVRFSEMSNDEIDWYVSTGDPVDKAGAYAVQGKAALFIAEIAGDYFNIVGLPIRLVYELVGRI
jgi:septum formation protein